VAYDHEGHSRQAESFYIKFARMKMDFIPDAGKLMRQVHIIAEQRLARGGMSAGDDPVVRSRSARFTAISGRRTRVPADGLDRGCLAVLLVGYGQRSCAIIGCAGRWTVMPGAHRVQICGKFR